jgi:tight adherence protein C
MDDWLRIAGALTGNAELARWAVLALVGIAVAVFAFGVGSLVSGAADPVRRRLGLDRRIAVPTGQAGARFAALVQPVSRYVVPSDEGERSKVAAQLRHAGFRGESAVSIFYGIKSLLALALPLVVLAVVQGVPRLSSLEVIGWCLGASGLGLLAPNAVLARLVERRHRELRNGFPDALDLLVVCVESGLGLSAALQRVAGELEVSHPKLAAELALVNAEIRAGVDREAALRNLADRTGLDDIRGLVGLLVQTMRFGTGVADALRIYSSEFRDRRMQRAEEAAAKISTKLIFPLVCCLFPGFFIVAVGPAVLRLVEAFREMGGH